MAPAITIAMTTGANLRRARATAMTMHARSDVVLATIGKNQIMTGETAMHDPRWADRDRDTRERDREAADAFTRHVHLPRGPERELVRDRDREYTLARLRIPDARDRRRISSGLQS